MKESAKVTTVVRKQDSLKDYPAEYTVEQKTKMLELLNQNTGIFLRWAHSELVGLAEASRFFSFNKSTVLARKQQPVDYFGLIVSGTAVAIHDDAVIADLPCLEMIGYMAMMNLMGMHYHFFDILGDNDGVILTIRMEEMKELQNKHPTVFNKLNDMAAAKCIEVVRHQYLSDTMLKQVRTNSTYLTEKRINELFEFSNNALIKEFWAGLENKQKVAFGRAVRFIQMNPRDVLLQRQVSHSTMLIILKGQCVAISDTTTHPNTRLVLPQGDVFGITNFLEETPFDHNVYCRQKGVCIFVNKQMMDKISRDKSNLATQFYRFLVKQQTTEIKKGFESAHKASADEFFIEINLQKRRKGPELPVQQAVEKVEEFAKKYQVIPLHANEFYRQTVSNLKRVGLLDQNNKMKILTKLQSQHAVSKNTEPINKKTKTESTASKQQKNKVSNNLYQPVNPKTLSQFQSFFADKKAQLLHGKKAQIKAKKIDNKSIVVAVNLERNFTQQDQQLNAKRISSLQNENGHLKKQIELLRDSISQSNMLIRNQTDSLTETNTRLNKIEVHKELLKRSEGAGGVTVTGNKIINTLSLMDVYSQQLKQNQKYRLVAKCAYRWLYLTRRRLRLKGKSSGHILMA